MSTSFTIYAGGPHTLTKGDVAAFRVASGVAFLLHGVVPDAERPWEASAELSRLTLYRPRKKAWSGGWTDDSDSELRYEMEDVLVRCSGYSSTEGTFGESNYRERSAITIESVHFYEMFLGDSEDWGMFVTFVKPGDEISVSVAADCGNQYVSGAGLHQDETKFLIHRPKTGKRYAFLVSTSIGQNNSARMVHGTYAKDWHDPSD